MIMELSKVKQHILTLLTARAHEWEAETAQVFATTYRTLCEAERIEVETAYYVSQLTPTITHQQKADIWKDIQDAVK